MMDIDNIKYWINQFNTEKANNIYNIETALMIYELFEKNSCEITNNEIENVGKLIRKCDSIFDEYLRYQVKESENKEECDLDIADLL